MKLDRWTRGLLYVVAAYPLVDYIMRSVLKVPVLGSLWDELVLVGLAAILAVIWWWGQAPASDLREAGVTLDRPLLLFLLYGLFMVFFNLADMSINVEGFRSIFQYILVFFLGFYLVRDTRTLYTILYIMVGVGLLLGLHGIFQYAVGAPMPSHWVEAGENVRTRAYSILGSPNVLGSYMAFASLLAAGLGLQRVLLVVSARKNRKTENKNTNINKNIGKDSFNNVEAKNINTSDKKDILNKKENANIKENEKNNINKKENILRKLVNSISTLISNLINSRILKAIYASDILMSILLVFSAGVMALCLLLTFSRGALLAWAGAVVIVAVIMAIWYDKRMIFAIVGVGVVAVLALMVVAPSVVERMIFVFSPEYLAKSAQGGRVTRWLNALDQMRHEPFFGAGLGHYGGAVGARHYATIYVDNYYAKTWAEMGLIGISLFVWLIGALVTNVVGTWRRVWGGPHAMVVAGILGGLLAVILHNGVENIFEVPFMTVIFWLTAGIGLAMPSYIGRGDNSDDRR